MYQFGDKGSMAKIDTARIWSLNFQLLSSVIMSVSPAITQLGLESKELFLLAEIDAHPYPAELAVTCSMPKATVTVYLKRLGSTSFLRREIDAGDLRRHRILVTPAGRKVMTRGLAHIESAFGERL